MTEATDTADDLDVPAAGSPVWLLASSRDVAAVAEVESWSASPSGLVVTSHLVMHPEIARMLDGQRAWVSAYTRLTSTLVVFEGMARQTRPDQPGRLTLDGVSMIAREHRRAGPRAHVACEVDLRVDEGRGGAARTIDLSRNGCRVRLREPDVLAVGETAVAELTLPDTTVVRTSCRVLRLDESQREAVLTFGELSDTDATAVTRAVFTQLSASGPASVPAGA